MIELENVSKYILENFNLKINEGEFVTIIGGNGAGKSTLFNIINGNYKPTDGRVVLDGKDITKMSRCKRASILSCVYQDPNAGVCPELTVAENLAVANFKTRATFSEQLGKFGLGLEGKLKQKVSNLSGGQRQVVTLLMATMRKPKLLLLDEHTSALDPKIAKTVMRITELLVREQKITTVMITHNMSDAIAYGERLVMLQGGKIVMDVTGDAKRNLTAIDLLKKFE